MLSMDFIKYYFLQIFQCKAQNTFSNNGIGTLGPKYLVFQQILKKVFIKLQFKMKDISQNLQMVIVQISDIFLIFIIILFLNFLFLFYLIFSLKFFFFFNPLDFLNVVTAKIIF